MMLLQAVIEDLHRGVGFNPDREDLFRDKFLECLKGIGVRPSCFGPDRLREIIRLTYEACQNVYDHANRKPAASGGRIDSRLTISRAGDDAIRVIIEDEGVGIAARMALTPAIYEGDIAEEEALVRGAFEPRGSSKLAAQDCRIRGTAGYGFTYILHAIRGLRAEATLSTGRLRFDLGGTDGVLTIMDDGNAYAPGTRLDVVIGTEGAIDR